jgi:hypothetical protein
MIRIVTSSSGRVGAATIPGWAVALGGVAAVSIGLVILVLGAGLALLLAPVAIGAAFLARWRLKKAFAEAAAEMQRGQARTPDGVIDAEYRVIDDRRP